MQNLAELTFAYLWHLMFTNEDVLELDHSVSLLETSAHWLASMTDDEKSALIQVATDTQARLLKAPDEHGHTARQRVTDEQRRFLADVISGEFFTQFE